MLPQGTEKKDGNLIQDCQPLCRALIPEPSLYVVGGLHSGPRCSVPGNLAQISNRWPILSHYPDILPGRSRNTGHVLLFGNSYLFTIHDQILALSETTSQVIEVCNGVP
jgi:hypothetical protein